MVWPSPAMSPTHSVWLRMWQEKTGDVGMMGFKTLLHTYKGTSKFPFRCPLFSSPYRAGCMRFRSLVSRVSSQSNWLQINGTSEPGTQERELT